jgi:hypothetical protein
MLQPAVISSTSTVFHFYTRKACEGSVKVHLEYCYISGQRARGGKSALRKTLKCEIVAQKFFVARSARKNGITKAPHFTSHIQLVHLV